MPTLRSFSLYTWLFLVLILGNPSSLLAWEAVPPPAKNAKVKQIKKKRRQKARRARSAPRQQTTSTKRGTFGQWLLYYSMMVLSILILLACLVSMVYCVLGMIWFFGFGWDILFPFLIALFLYLGIGTITVMRDTFSIASYAKEVRPDYGPLLAILGGLVAINLFILGLMLGLTWLWVGVVIAVGSFGLGVGLFILTLAISMG